MIPCLTFCLRGVGVWEPLATSSKSRSPCSRVVVSLREDEKSIEYFFFFWGVCFTSYFMFRIAVLPLSPGVVYHHLLLRRETRILGVAPFSFRIGIWDLFVHKGTEILYTHSLWEVVDHYRSKMHKTCLIIIHDHNPYEKKVYVFWGMR